MDSITTNGTVVSSPVREVVTTTSNTPPALPAPATGASVTAFAVATTNGTAAGAAVIRKPQGITRTIRIHINTTDQPRPVIFNYRQLYKREVRKFEETGAEIIAAPAAAPPNDMDSADDVYFRQLLQNAESYAMADDDDGDDDDEEETMVGGKKGGPNDDYDFEDPFIDDSEMLMDDLQEYSKPEFDGFFVYHGPLDGHEETEKKSSTAITTAPKRKAPSKPKTSTSTSATTATTANKRGGAGVKKVSDDHSTEESAAKKSTSSIASVGKPAKKQTTITQALKAANSAAVANGAASNTETKAAAKSSTSSATSTTTVRKTASNTDQPAKKRKKVENKEPVAADDKSLSLLSSSSVKEEQQTSQEKKKKSTSTSSSAPPAKLEPLDPEIEVLMEKLRRDVVKEDFENKAKFPVNLKPTVLEAGLIMLRKIRTIDENLVFHLMKILPYNRFTLKKFLTTKSGQLRVEELQQEIDELAILLKQTIDKMMPEQSRLFNEKLAQAQAALAANPPKPKKPSTNEEGEEEDEENALPTPKFKCNDEVRKILYDIIQTEERSIHIANQVALHKDTEKKTEVLASDNKARKLMYQRLLSCWPEDWMNSYEMSRQYSQYKSKVSISAEKKANASTTTTINNKPLPTPVTSGSSSSQADAAAAAKKRKRVPTPQSSPSDEGIRKKQSIVDTGIVPPDSSTLTQKIKESTAVAVQPQPQKQQIQKSHRSTITIDDDDNDDDDDDDDEPPAAQQTSWKQSNSMKIEALISGPNNTTHKKS